MELRIHDDADRDDASIDTATVDEDAHATAPSAERSEADGRSPAPCL